MFFHLFYTSSCILLVCLFSFSLFFFFFFNDTATTEIYTLSLHDALPIHRRAAARVGAVGREAVRHALPQRQAVRRSEEHTSELQSLAYLVCRLLLEKKKQSQESTDDEHIVYYKIMCNHCEEHELICALMT